MKLLVGKGKREFKSEYEPEYTEYIWNTYSESQAHTQIVTWRSDSALRLGVWSGAEGSARGTARTAAGIRAAVRRALREYFILGGLSVSFGSSFVVKCAQCV